MSRRTSLRARLVRTAALVGVGAVALSGCDFSVYDLPLPGGADLGDDPYAVTVEFRDVLDLVPQSSVKVDDVTVGRVDEIDLDGYTAEVTVLLRSDVELPDNAVAQIRQTSLLGEKFVSLAPPPSGAREERLGDGDTIGLDRTGRNPEVEEVLGALSLLLNGGGVAQLKTISTELNKALEGRESDVRSVLDRLEEFMGRLDENKGTIIRAIESLNRLAVSLKKQEGAITTALDELPAALASVDRQRDDLVKMLRALSDLSSVGTRVIRDSKAATVDSLEALAPTLTKLAEAGDALPRSLQVFLTYPFVDSVVGKNPAVARNLHMGDYTNLSVQMDLLFTGEEQNPLPDPGEVCEETPLDPVCQELPDPQETLSLVERCLESGDPASRACRRVLADEQMREQLREECERPRHDGNPVCAAVETLPDPDVPGGPDLPSDVPAAPVPVPGVGRSAFGPGPSAPEVAIDDFDSELAPLLVWGLMER